MEKQQEDQFSEGSQGLTELAEGNNAVIVNSEKPVEDAVARGEKKPEYKKFPPSHFKIAPSATWEFALPQKYNKLFESTFKKYSEANAGGDSALELMALRITEQEILYAVIRDYQLQNSYLLDDKGMPRERETQMGQRYFEIYKKARFYLGGGKYHADWHRRQIDIMIREFMNRTQLGRRELGRMKAFADAVIRTVNTHLGTIPGIDEKKILKIKAEIERLLQGVYK